MTSVIIEIWGKVINKMKNYVKFCGVSWPTRHHVATPVFLVYSLTTCLLRFWLWYLFRLSTFYYTLLHFTLWLNSFPEIEEAINNMSISRSSMEALYRAMQQLAVRLLGYVICLKILEPVNVRPSPMDQCFTSYLV